MISKAFITGDIRLKIAIIVDGGNLCDVSLFCTEYLADKLIVDSDDSSFYIACADDFVRRTAASCISLYKPKSSETDAQLTLDGFNHLQKAYPVMRYQRQILVPINLMSDDELNVRAKDLMAMAAGCEKHADEIVRYVGVRQSSQSAQSDEPAA